MVKMYYHRYTGPQLLVH